MLNPTDVIQNNLPYSTARMFAAGEMPAAACAQPFIDGAAAARWQCQAVNSWPDGSLKYALVDFVIPVLPVAGVVVDFRASASTSGGGGALTKAEVLAATWQADAQFTFNTGTVDVLTVVRDLRTIFGELTENASCVIGSETSTTRKLHRRRDGPVLTEWIVEDLCTTLAYDFGTRWDGAKWIDAGPDYDSLHPYFVLTAYKDYPAIGLVTVKVRFVVENGWTRKHQNQVYRQRFRAGPALAVLEEQTVDYTHHSGSVYSFEGWATATSVPQVVDDPNLPYLIYSKAIPAFISEVVAANITQDTMVPVEILNDLINISDAKLGIFNGTVEKPQYCRALVSTCRQGSSCCSFWTKVMTIGGDSHELGMVSTYFTRWLYLARNPNISASLKREYWNRVFLRMAHAGGNAPMQFRESRSAAAYCANNCDTPAYKTLNEFGRTVSVDAHPTEGFLNFTPNYHAAPAGCSAPPCRATTNGWNIDSAHQAQQFYMPALLTGDFYWLRLLEGLAAFQQGLANSAATTLTGRNGRMNCMGWGGSTSARWPAWKMRNLIMAAVVMPSSTESENYFRQLQNTAACEEGYLELTAAEGAIQHNPAAGSPWRFGYDIWRTRDTSALPLTHTANPYRVWEHRIVGAANIIHQSDSYDSTGVNSAHAPWMTTYYMATISFIRDHGFTWFNTLQQYVPKLVFAALDNNPYLAFGFNIPTHKVIYPRHAVAAATPMGANTIRFNVPGHGFANGNIVVVCCTNLAWPNGWRMVETTDGKDIDVNTVGLPVTVVNENNFDLTAPGWANPTGTYPSCCTIVGKYKLFVARKTGTGFPEDGGPYQSQAEYLAAIHPRMQELSDWPEWSSYRIFQRWGSYSDVAVALVSAMVDARIPASDDARRVVAELKSLNERYWYAMSSNTADGCSGLLIPRDTYCGNMTWMIWPRPRIDNAAVTAAATSIAFEFIAPTGDGAKVAVTTALNFANSRDEGDVPAVCKGRSCIATISGLTANTAYRYRITAGAMRGTTRLEGSISTIQ